MIRMNSNGKLFIVFGPSGSGKSTLVNRLIEKIPAISNVITYTCRLPRSYEQNAKDYYFITQEDFVHKIKTDFFIHTNEYLNLWYGCPRSITQDLKLGKHLIVILDRNGAKHVSQIIPDAKLIWISTSLDNLKKQLMKRNTETIEQVNKRLLRAEQEIKDESNEKLHHYQIMNINLERSTKSLIELIQKEIISSTMSA